MISPLLFSCHSADTYIDEEAVENPAQEEPAPAALHRLKITARLPEPDGGRAQITYDNQDVEAGEFFMWNDQDWVTLFNITRLDECPEGVELETTEIKGRTAVFETLESLGDCDLKIYAGDTLFVNYWTTLRMYEDDGVHFDPRKIFTITVGSEENKPQEIVENPGTGDLEYMRHNLKMYDIVVAEEDGVVPEINFRHLSAIMRVTLRNESGKDLYPTKLEFKYPDTQSFFAATMCCSVVPDESGGSKLHVYDSGEFYTKAVTYTDSIGTTINKKIGTADAGGYIKNGDTYELYITCVPRLNNDRTGTELTISLIDSHTTSTPYSVTLRGFNVPIKAGYRYWFDLTATPDGNLMLSNLWDDQHNNP